VSDLQEKITDGDLAPGKRLPSRGVLAKQYGVSHFTIVGALAELSALGYVSTRPRSGVFVEGRLGGLVASEFQKTASPLALSTVAVIGSMPAISDAPYLRHHSGWQAATVIGVFDALRERGLHPLVLRPTAVDNDLAAHIPTYVGGVVIMEDCLPEVARYVVSACLNAGTPVVSGCNATRDMDCDHVRFDFERGGLLLSSWLFDRGCRNVVPLQVNDPGDYWSDERYAGYASAAAKQGIVPSKPITMEQVEISAPEEWEIRARIAAGYIAEAMRANPKPDAFILPSDGFAGYFGRALELNGLKPNVDVRLAGYDNYWADLPQRMGQPPPAVTIDKGNLSFGAALVRSLEERKQRGRYAEPTTQVIEPLLITADELNAE
jgi:DNA-binding LacI/PurR family transcriptional regulator